VFLTSLRAVLNDLSRPLLHPPHNRNIYIAPSIPRVLRVSSSPIISPDFNVTFFPGSRVWCLQLDNFELQRMNLSWNNTDLFESHGAACAFFTGGGTKEFL
jgi:hypothetical protein